MHSPKDFCIVARILFFDLPHQKKTPYSSNAHPPLVHCAVPRMHSLRAPSNTSASSTTSQGLCISYPSPLYIFQETSQIHPTLCCLSCRTISMVSSSPYSPLQNSTMSFEDLDTQDHQCEKVAMATKLKDDRSQPKDCGSVECMLRTGTFHIQPKY